MHNLLDTHWSVIIGTLTLHCGAKQTVIGCLLDGPWPMKAAMESRPPAISVRIWLFTYRHSQRDRIFPDHRLPDSDFDY